MIALILSPIYIILNVYIVKWLLRWMSSCSKYFKSDIIKKIIISIYIFLASSPLIGFLLPKSLIQRIIKLIGNYYMGLFGYIILVVLGADLIRIILYKTKILSKEKLPHKKLFILSGTICIIFILTITLLGVINARVIHTTNYEITIDKKTTLDNLKIVMVSDLHLGYNIGTVQMNKMVKKINKEKPDIVIIAGDIFDNDYDSLDDPEKLIRIFRSIESKYGVYAVYGNHDIQEKNLVGFTFNFENNKKLSDLRMDEFLEKANINLLKDDYILIDDSVYIYGRADYINPGRKIDKLRSPKEIMSNLDKTKPIIVVEHEPVELNELSRVGVDLELSGHTHNGQIFPLNILIKLFWENSYGYLKKGNMHSIVTSGVGVFGPNMRIGTKAEIVVVDIDFKK